VSKALEKFRKGHNVNDKELKSRDEMLEYFATFSDEIPRMIEGEYMRCATELGPSSKQCRQLSKLLYQAASLSVDSGKLRKELEQMKLSTESALNWELLHEQKIWKNMDEKAKDFVKEMQRKDEYGDGCCTYHGAERRANGYFREGGFYQFPY